MRISKITHFITVLAICVVASGKLFAQTTTLLDQTLLTQQSFATFTPVSVSGTQVWTFSSTYGAVCSGYSGGQNYANEDWLVGPAINLSQMNNVLLTFSHTRGNASVMNVGVSEGWYKIYATANYTGNPATTTWTELTGVNQNITTAWQYISSGNVTIPAAAKSASSRIAFRYMSSAAQSATWEIKNVKVTGEPAGSEAYFKVTNWNTEWLGCLSEGPTDETQQLNNVAAAMQAMNSDIYCIQEITNTAASPTIASLVSLLGSSDWAGAIVPNTTDDCDQRQAIIYKKARVQLVGSSELNTGSAAQGNSYYYNWSSGRYPAVYNVNFVAGTTLVPITIVNIHAKAEDGNSASYTRRLGASQALKTILDGAAYNTKRFIVIGDYNDYLTGTSSTTCNCTDSPYKNFADDTSRYSAVTQPIIDVDTNFGTHPIIENILLSNELSGNYVASSAFQEVTMPQTITGYYNTTTNHLPVSMQLQFTALGTDNSQVAEVRSAYPNPVKDKLIISGSSPAQVTVTDLSGKQLLQRDNTLEVDFSQFQEGVYLLRITDQSGAVSTKKIVKE